MSKFIMYERTTGEIKGTASGNVVAAGSLSLMQVTGDYSSNYYVDLTLGAPTEASVRERSYIGVVASKPTIKADGSDTTFISNIPSGATCLHDDEAHVITDGLIEFTADHPGTYTFEFSLFPYKPTTITIEASDDAN